MQFSFNLEWNELPEDFRESKIDEMIEYNFTNGNLLDDDGCPLYPDLDSALESIDLRRSTESFIEVHFPMYF